MAKISKNFSDYIKTKNLTIGDDFYKLSGSYINTDYGFNYIAYDALKDVNDVKTNNLSNIILTKKQKRSDLLSASVINKTTFDDFISPISFFSQTDSNSLNQPVYLVIDNSYDDYDIDAVNTEVKLIEGVDTITSSMLFRIECVDEQYCYISSNIGDATFYLCYDGSFHYTVKKNDSCKFIYHLRDNELQLYTNYKAVLYAVYCKKNNKGYTLDISSE